MAYREGDMVAKASWFTRRRLIVPGAVLTLLAVLGFAVVGGANPKHTPSGKPAVKAASTSEPTASPANTPAPTSSLPQVLVDLQGTSAKASRVFTVADQWDLEWSYDCSTLAQNPALRKLAKFVLVVYTADRQPFRDIKPLNKTALKGSGLQHYHKAGQYILGVNSLCTWHATAKGPAPTPTPSTQPQ